APHYRRNRIGSIFLPARVRLSRGRDSRASAVRSQSSRKLRLTLAPMSEIAAALRRRTIDSRATACPEAEALADQSGFPVRSDSRRVSDRLASTVRLGAWRGISA